METLCFRSTSEHSMQMSYCRSNASIENKIEMTILSEKPRKTKKPVAAHPQLPQPQLWMSNPKEAKLNQIQTSSRLASAHARDLTIELRYIMICRGYLSSTIATTSSTRVVRRDLRSRAGRIDMKWITRIRSSKKKSTPSPSTPATTSPKPPAAPKDSKAPKAKAHSACPWATNTWPEPSNSTTSICKIRVSKTMSVLQIVRWSEMQRIICCLNATTKTL